jgi:hypothetical protein
MWQKPPKRVIDPRPLGNAQSRSLRKEATEEGSCGQGTGQRSRRLAVGHRLIRHRLLSGRGEPRCGRVGIQKSGNFAPESAARSAGAQAASRPVTRNTRSRPGSPVCCRRRRRGMGEPIEGAAAGPQVELAGRVFTPGLQVPVSVSATGRWTTDCLSTDRRTGSARKEEDPAPRDRRSRL